MAGETNLFKLIKQTPNLKLFKLAFTFITMVKHYNLLFLIILSIFTINCSSDDNDCPDTMTVDIDDPESLRRAEECGLSPAGPLGEVWVSEKYRLNHLQNAEK